MSGRLWSLYEQHEVARAALTLAKRNPRTDRMTLTELARRDAALIEQIRSKNIRRRRRDTDRDSQPVFRRRRP